MTQATVPYGRITQKQPAVAELHILWITAGLGCDGDSVPSPLPRSPVSKTCSSEPFPDYPKFICTIPCSPTRTATNS